jgi:hypothetical protein
LWKNVGRRKAKARGHGVATVEIKFFTDITH